MIERIEGIIQEITDSGVVLQAHAISFGIIVPHTHPFSVGVNATLLIYMHWNQENGPSLYGFQSALDRTLFIMIIGCSGIGPKLAIAILHDVGAAGFIQAISAHDDRALSKVSGIGTKKAEHIIVHLKHKISKLISSGIDLGDAASLSLWHDIDQALTSLNYSRSEISYTLDTIKKEGDAHALPFDQLLRRALSYITRKQ